MMCPPGARALPPFPRSRAISLFTRRYRPGAPLESDRRARARLEAVRSSPFPDGDFEKAEARAEGPEDPTTQRFVAAHPRHRSGPGPSARESKGACTCRDPPARHVRDEIPEAVEMHHLAARAAPQ